MWNDFTQIKECLRNQNDRKVYLFGASITGENCLLHIRENYHAQVAAFIDNDINKQGTAVMGVPVIGLKELNAEKFRDLIIISSNKLAQIEKQLLEYGISNYVKFNRDFLDYAFNYSADHYKTYCSPAERALQWLKNAALPDGGIAFGTVCKTPYPEVTGYIVPTLIQYGVKDIAADTVAWLCSIQKEDGGYSGTSGEREYVFDTAQILRGLTAAWEADILRDIVETTMQKACEYLISRMLEEGRGGYIKEYNEGGKISETILIYTIVPIIKAAEILKNEKYKECAWNCFEYYRKQNRLMDVRDLTHFVAYQIEAFIELGYAQDVREKLDYYKRILLEKAMIPAREGDEWVCTPGMAQLAKCWYLCGDWETADRAMEWLEKHQSEDGGFIGGIGPGADYFPLEELSWAVKYYLDANYLRVQTHFDVEIQAYPEKISEEDGRYLAILKYVREMAPDASVIEIGCGKGRFLRQLKQDFPGLELTGVDISKEMLKCVPKDIKTLWGTLENIPVSQQYDIVFSVEAVEHSVNKEKAVEEMARIVKPGGYLVIIDKNIEYWGLVKCPPWEKWLDKQVIVEAMEKWLHEVKVEDILLENYAKGYMVAWSGRK